jgi:hypothetical protein
MEELKIQVPDGYEVDKENSTFETIKFKKKKGLPSSWGELGEVGGYFVAGYSEIESISYGYADENNRNIFATKEQAEAAIALAQLSQLYKVYREFEGGEIDWTKETRKYTIIRIRNKIHLEIDFTYPSFLAFTKEETRDLFYDNFKDLIKQAKPFL